MSWPSTSPSCPRKNTDVEHRNNLTLTTGNDSNGITRKERMNANASDTRRYNLGFGHDGREAPLKCGSSASAFYGLKNVNRAVY